MQFSIIIPTCNRNESLAFCLDRLKPGAQTLDANHYEVIISDDGKNNEAKELVEKQYNWARWVEGPKCGPAANRNNGAKWTTGKWLVFTDDDCLPDANWLRAYWNAIQQYPNCRAFEGAILPDDWNLLKKDMAECPVNDKGGCFWSANIMVEKKLFWEVGGFDEQFKIAAQEDQDLQNRIKTIQFIESAIIIHPVRVLSFKEKWLKTPVLSINWIQWRIKNGDSLKTIKKDAFENTIRYLWASFEKGHFKSAIYWLLSIFFFYPRMGSFYSKALRKSQQSKVQHL